MLNALVTVGIATFNSSKYIIESLESVKNQSYNHIELIVSDDCSKDNTIEKINIWLNTENNRARFTNANVLVVKSNTGVSANCNRIFSAAKGEYIKLLAGDDILLPNCIADNIQFIVKNGYLPKVVFSQVELFKDEYIQENIIEVKPLSLPENMMHPSFDAAKQFQQLLISDRITYTPSVFFNKEAVLSVGGFDESFRLVEDYPMWLKLTRAGIQLYYFDGITVAYRVHSNATNNIGGDFLFSPARLNNYTVRKKYVFPHLSSLVIINEKYEYFFIKLFIRFKLNKKSNASFFYLVTRYINPFWLIFRLSRI